MTDFRWRIHKNSRLNLREAFGRQTLSSTQTLASPSVAVFSGVSATKNTTTDFTVNNLAITSTSVQGHDGFTTPASQSVEFTLSAKSSASGGHYIVKTLANISGSTEVLYELTDLVVESKAAT